MQSNPGLATCTPFSQSSSRAPWLPGTAMCTGARCWEFYKVFPNEHSAARAARPLPPGKVRLRHGVWISLIIRDKRILSLQALPEGLRPGGPRTSSPELPIQPPRPLSPAAYSQDRSSVLCLRTPGPPATTKAKPGTCPLAEVEGQTGLHVQSGGYSLFLAPRSSWPT